MSYTTLRASTELYSFNKVFYKYICYLMVSVLIGDECEEVQHEWSESADVRVVIIQ